MAKRLAQMVAIGAIFAAFSEFWFYQIDTGTGLAALVLIYGLFGHLFILTLRVFQARAFAGFFVSAAMFGFMIEGIPVPQLYLSLPFSIAWTPLAWHALFTVSVGYFLYRRIMATGSARARALLNITIGLGLGIWNAYLWNVVEDETAGSIAWAWHPVSEFAPQFLAGWVLFIGGHLLFDRFPPPPRPAPREFLIFLALAMLTWLLGWFLPLFPFSLILPFLLVVSLASLNAGRASPNNSWLARLFSLRIPARHYTTAILLPATAIATYATMKTLELEWETNVPVALITVPVSTFYWLYAILRANHAGHKTTPGPAPDLRLDER